MEGVRTKYKNLDQCLSEKSASFTCYISYTRH